MELRLSAEETMNEKDLLLQASGIQTMYFDGFGAYRKINGLLRCIGYVNESGAQLNLIVSVEGARQANIDARIALAGRPITGDSVFSTARLHH